MGNISKAIRFPILQTGIIIPTLLTHKIFVKLKWMILNTLDLNSTFHFLKQVTNILQLLSLPLLRYYSCPSVSRDPTRIGCLSPRMLRFWCPDARIRRFHIRGFNRLWMVKHRTWCAVGWIRGSRTRGYRGADCTAKFWILRITSKR